MYDPDFELQVKAAALVEDIWLKYDTNSSGTLEAEAIRTLIQEVMEYDHPDQEETKITKDAPTLEEATRFISFLDIDGDGCIDKSEFLTFICNALAMSIDLRIQFAQRSPMHAKVRRVMSGLLFCWFLLSWQKRDCDILTVNFFIQHISLFILGDGFLYEFD